MKFTFKKVIFLMIMTFSLQLSYRFLFIPALYEFILENETKENSIGLQRILSFPGFFEITLDENIITTYYKVEFLLNNGFKKVNPGEILVLNLKNSNFILRPPIHYINSSEDRQMFFYSIDGWKDFFKINGIHSKNVMIFLKYKFGVPFFITDDLNMIWDSLMKGKAFSYSSDYQNLEKSKVNNKSSKVDPRIFYYSYSLFDILERHNISVKINYNEEECSAGVLQHINDLKERFSNINIFKQ